MAIVRNNTLVDQIDCTHSVVAQCSIPWNKLVYFMGVNVKFGVLFSLRLEMAHLFPFLDMLDVLVFTQNEPLPTINMQYMSLYKYTMTNNSAIAIESEHVIKTIGPFLSFGIFTTLDKQVLLHN